jgi:hypothetical protein
MQTRLSKIIFYGLGKIASVICAIPYIGKSLVSALWKFSATVVFKVLFLFSNKPHRNIQEVKTAWHSFLALCGIYPHISKEEDEQYFWFTDACPYGFCTNKEKDVCDAVMEFDRKFTRLLGGRLEIVDCIPDGADKCRYITRICLP